MSSLFTPNAAPLVYMHKQLQPKNAKQNTKKLYSVRRPNHRNKEAIRESLTVSEKANITKHNYGNGP